MKIKKRAKPYKLYYIAITGNLKATDEIILKYFNNPNLELSGYTVNSDGSINLEFYEQIKGE